MKQTFYMIWCTWTEIINAGSNRLQWTNVQVKPYCIQNKNKDHEYTKMNWGHFDCNIATQDHCWQSQRKKWGPWGITNISGHAKKSKSKANEPAPTQKTCTRACPLKQPCLWPQLLYYYINTLKTKCLEETVQGKTPTQRNVFSSNDKYSWFINITTLAFEKQNKQTKNQSPIEQRKETPNRKITSHGLLLWEKRFVISTSSLWRVHVITILQRSRCTTQTLAWAQGWA